MVSEDGILYLYVVPATNLNRVIYSEPESIRNSMKPAIVERVVVVVVELFLVKISLVLQRKLCIFDPLFVIFAGTEDNIIETDNINNALLCHRAEKCSSGISTTQPTIS